MSELGQQVVEHLKTRRGWTTAEKLMDALSVTSKELCPVLNVLEAQRAVICSAFGYKTPKIVSTARVGDFRAEQTLKDRSRKDYYLTEDEHTLLKAYLKKLRGEKP